MKVTTTYLLLRLVTLAQHPSANQVQASVKKQKPHLLPPLLQLFNLHPMLELHRAPLVLVARVHKQVVEERTAHSPLRLNVRHTSERIGLRWRIRLGEAHIKPSMCL